MATMESLIGLVNRIQRACTVLGDHGGEGMSLWEALPSVAVVGGQVCHVLNSSFFSIFNLVTISFRIWSISVSVQIRVPVNLQCWKAWSVEIFFLVDPVNLLHLFFFLRINDLLYLFIFSPLFANLRDIRGISRCAIMLDFSFYSLVYSVLEDLHFGLDKRKLSFVFLHFLIDLVELVSSNHLSNYAIIFFLGFVVYTGIFSPIVPHWIISFINEMFLIQKKKRKERLLLEYWKVCWLSSWFIIYKPNLFCSMNSSFRIMLG